MLNIENINKLIEVLKSDRAKDHFDMGYWLAKNWGESALPSEINECGTVACIGGWCNIIQIEEDNDGFDTYGTDKAAKWLGIDTETAEKLFYPNEYYYITNPIYVIPVLEHLRATGKVDWSESPYAPDDNY